MSEWRPIPGFDDYLIDANGRVKNLKTDRTLLGTVNGDPYRTVWVAGRNRYIHHLVAAAFHGPRPDGLQVCHSNGDPLDNRASNLRYGTNAENNLDQVIHGTHYAASRTECPSGHEYNAENTILYRGRRYCRPCKRRHQLEYYHRKRVAA